MAQGRAAERGKGGKAARRRRLRGCTAQPRVRKEICARTEEYRRTCHRLGEGLRIVHAGE